MGAPVLPDKIRLPGIKVNPVHAEILFPQRSDDRSEERRVGKECYS